MWGFAVVRPETGPVEIPQPQAPPLHPGSERPEVVPPDVPPIKEPVIFEIFAIDK